MNIEMIDLINEGSDLFINKIDARGYSIRQKRTMIYCSHKGKSTIPYFYKEISQLGIRSWTFVVTDKNGLKYLVFSKDGYISKRGFLSISEDYGAYRIMSYLNTKGEQIWFYYEYTNRFIYDSLSQELKGSILPIFPKISGYWVVSNNNDHSKCTLIWQGGNGSQVLDYIAVDKFEKLGSSTNLFVGILKKNDITLLRLFLKREKYDSFSQQYYNISPLIVNEWFTEISYNGDNIYTAYTVDGYCRILYVNNNLISYWPLTYGGRYKDCFLKNDILFARKDSGYYDIIKKDGTLLSAFWNVTPYENHLIIDEIMSHAIHTIKYEDIERFYMDMFNLLKGDLCDMQNKVVKNENYDNDIVNHTGSLYTTAQATTLNIPDDNIEAMSEKANNWKCFVTYLRILPGKIEKFNYNTLIVNRSTKIGSNKDCLCVGDNIGFIFPDEKKLIIATVPKNASANNIHYPILYYIENIEFEIQSPFQRYIIFNKMCEKNNIYDTVQQFFNAKQEDDTTISEIRQDKDGILDFNFQSNQERFIYTLYMSLSEQSLSSDVVYDTIYSIISQKSKKGLYGKMSDKNLPWSLILNSCNEEKRYEFMTEYVRLTAYEKLDSVNAFERACGLVLNKSIQVFLVEIENEKEYRKTLKIDKIKSTIEKISNNIKNENICTLTDAENPQTIKLQQKSIETIEIDGISYRVGDRLIDVRKNRRIFVKLGCQVIFIRIDNRHENGIYEIEGVGGELQEFLDGNENSKIRDTKFPIVLLQSEANGNIIIADIVRYKRHMLIQHKRGKKILFILSRN